MARQRIVGGGHSVVEVNGQVVGRFSELIWSSAETEDEIFGVDSSEPCELAPGQVRVRGLLVMWRTTGDGGAEGAGLTVPTAELPRSPYFSLRLRDRIGGYVLFEADRCKVGSQEWTVRPKRLVEGRISFAAIGWANEVSVAP